MIPVSTPSIGESEKKNLLDCLEKGWISSGGPFVEDFEARWAKRCGRKYGVAVTSGTTALQLAVAALEIEHGSEILMPDLTIISCALAILYSGHTPVLMDSEPGTWTLDPEQLEKKITPKTKAVMAVHLHGHPAAMEPVMDFAKRRGLAVIEDAAQAACSQARAGTDWKPAGSFGTLSCFSFYANKMVTTGEGGMVVTDDAAMAERLRSLRNLAFGQKSRFVHERTGFNFRMTSLQAALGLAQLETLDQRIEYKKWLDAGYRRRFEGMRSIRFQEIRSWARPVLWMFGLVLEKSAGLDADAFGAKLRTKGIETRPFFTGMHEQPVFKKHAFVKGPFPVAENLSRYGLYLPSGFGLTEAELDQIAAAVREALH